MAEESSHVENEINEHKADLLGWISQVSTLPVPECQKGVVERFVRDCQTLVADVDKEKTPSAHDLSDFDDRKNSLEVQFYNITQDLQ